MGKKKFKVTDKRATEQEVPKIIEPERKEEVIPDAPNYADVKYEMMDDRILIQEFPPPEWIKHGGLYIGEGKTQPIDRGRIIGKGPNVKTLKIGDVIFKMSGLGAFLVAPDEETMWKFTPDNIAICEDKSFRTDKTFIACDNLQCEYHCPKSKKAKLMNKCTRFANVCDCGVFEADYESD